MPSEKVDVDPPVSADPVSRVEPAPDTGPAPDASPEAEPGTVSKASRLTLRSMMSREAVAKEDVVEAPVGAGEKSGVVEELAGDLAQTATALLETVPAHVGALIERGVENLADGLKHAVKGLLGGPGTPADSVPPPSIPAPPPMPVSSGCSSGSTLISGESGSCGGAAEKLFHQFAVLAPFSVVLPSVDGEVTWLSREPLVPNSAPRPPNERPG